jgi:hypothetical protein
MRAGAPAATSAWVDPGAPSGSGQATILSMKADPGRDLVDRRLFSQGLAEPMLEKPAAIVARLGAVQAQDYAAAKWGLGLRGRGLDDAAVEKAFAQGAILRTHVMRPTWHFVTPRDIRWMLALTGPRVSALMAHDNRKLELDGRVFARSHATLARALEGGVYRTREELAATLGRAGIHAKGQRLGHLMMQAELDQVICSGLGLPRTTTVVFVDGAPCTLAHARRAAREASRRGRLRIPVKATWAPFSVLRTPAFSLRGGFRRASISSSAASYLRRRSPMQR